MAYVPRRDFERGGRGGEDGGYDGFMKAKGRRKSSQCSCYWFNISHLIPSRLPLARIIESLPVRKNHSLLIQFQTLRPLLPTLLPEFDFTSNVAVTSSSTPPPTRLCRQ